MHSLTLVFIVHYQPDVGSWREGGGRNLNVAPSSSETDSKPSEELGVGSGTPSPSGDSDEAGKPSAGEGREKRDARDRLPPTAPQHKLNGGQQPPGAGGMSSQFHAAQFRSMMPPYVSDYYLTIVYPFFYLLKCGMLLYIFLAGTDFVKCIWQCCFNVCIFSDVQCLPPRALSSCTRRL